MKFGINLDRTPGTLRLIPGIEYILRGSHPIVISTSKDQEILYHKCLGNGTEEVFFQPSKNPDPVWIFYWDSPQRIEFDENEFVLANHQPDVTPDFVSEEYPLFQKLMEYYFRYIGMSFEPSGFIHRMEEFAHIDETFDEFRNYIYEEVLYYFLEDVKVDKTILAKYILDFYSQRGTEDSILFLLYVLTGQYSVIDKRRKSVLIVSDKVQGVLSNASIVLQDNYMSQLFSYVIYLNNETFSKYKDVLYKLVNPDGYLPFGVNIRNPVSVMASENSINIIPV